MARPDLVVRCTLGVENGKWHFHTLFAAVGVSVRVTGRSTPCLLQLVFPFESQVGPHPVCCSWCFRSSHR